MGWWFPRRGWLGQDGLTRDLNDLTRPAVPSGAIQERMLARPRSAVASSAGHWAFPTTPEPPPP